MFPRAANRRLFLLAVALWWAGTGNAQTNTGGLSGTVVDESGAVLPGVKITIENENTVTKRILHTDGAGRYVAAQLLPGPYRITAQQTGFRTGVFQGIVVTVGQETVTNLTLQVGTISTEVTVTADAELVNTRSAAVSGLMNNQFIRELPLNGRDVHQLALLEPGMVMARRSSDAGGAGVKLVANGSRPSQNSFLLDGSDINDASNQTPGTTAGVMLGVDTLQEFRVLTNSYSAVYGRAAGGVISAVTKTGTNQFHGSAFEFIRNSAVDARNFFDQPDEPIPPFKRNQFGVEVDGPIRRDRTFFMASYEGLRERLGVTTTAVVPGEEARRGNLGSQTVTVQPVVLPYLALVPLPNVLPLLSDGTGRYVTAVSQSTDGNFSTARLDHRLSDQTSLFARYTYDGAKKSVPDNLGLSLATSTSRNQYFTTELAHIVNERLLNTFRFSYNKSLSTSRPDYLRPVDPALSFLPGQPFGQISVTGLFSLGPSRFGPSFLNMNLYHFSNNAAYTTGRHSLNLGGDFRFYRLPQQQVQSPYGFYQFNSLANFLRAVPSSVEMTLPSSRLIRNFRQSMLDFYLQDDIQVNRRLTLNLGLRYERVSEPDEADGLLSNLRDLRDPRATPGRLFENPSNRNFAPRVGIAWDPFGNGMTSVRSGFGIFYSQLWSDFYSNAGNRQPPYYILGSINNPVFPDAYSLINSPSFVLGRQDVIQYRPNSPYAMQFNVSVQRQVASGTVLTVGYSGGRGIHLVRLLDGNQALPVILADGRYCFTSACSPEAPATSRVQNPNFTGIRYKPTSGQSNYNALQVSFEQRFVKGLLLRLNYTFSRNIDNGTIEITQGGDNDLPQNPYDPRAERGLSNYDVRNYFVMYWTWDVPSLPGPRWLGAGWRWNAITTLASGNPFSAVVSFDRAGARFQSGTSPGRPDLAPGRSSNPVLGDPAQYFDPSAFALPPAGMYGNLGRNTLIGPGLAKVDFSLSKRFQVAEAVGLDLRAEAFNLFNRPNFSIPTARAVFSGVNATTGEPVRVSSAGLITSTQTSSRQLQLGLKLIF
ncbi:MAG TPA: TonB-dependent receptor [Terriglobia bacterium]|nr:TonB-dependent receptor [Terriglobia bacterium]